MRQEQIIRPLFVDTDTVDTQMEENSVRYLLNCDISNIAKGKMGAITNRKGNTEVVFALPAGENKCVGTYEDKAGKTIIYLVKNSEGNHKVLRYFFKTKTIEEVYGTETLAFDKQITGIALQKDLFFWTDGEKPQRKINISKANLNGKKVTGNMYFGIEDTMAYADGSNFYFEYVAGNVTISQLIYTAAGLNNLNGLLTAIVNAFNGTFLAGLFTMTAKGTYIEITCLTDDFQVFRGFSDNSTCYFVYQNRYAEPYIEDYISLIKCPPTIPITGTYSTDIKRKQNFIQEKTFQFCARFIYDDDEKSAWGPISKLFFSEDELINYIDLSFSEERLQNSTCIIKRVEIAMREGNLGKWQSVISLDQFEYLLGTYKFYNDGNYAALADNDILKPYDAVPLSSRSLDIAKSRLFLGGNTEGFDPVNINMKTTVDFTDNAEVKTWTISGKVRIINKIYPENTIGTPSYYSDNQVIHDSGHGAVFGGMGSDVLLNDEWEDDLHDQYDQRIPEGGFIVYLAGTPYYGISKQYWTFYNGGAGTINLKNDNPVIYDSSEWGYSPFVHKRKFRSAIRELMSQDRGYSDFDIKGVPPGKYIIRVASHWCSKGDSLGKGSMYDLNKGLDWQKTSTNAFQVAGLPGTEYIIELGPEGGIFDLRNLDTGGDTLIEDLSFPTGNLTGQNHAVSFAGYLIDSNGSTNPDDMALGQRMENQEMNLKRNFIYVKTFYTDHNGYFYNTQYEVIPGISVYEANVVSGTGGSGAPLKIKDYNQEKFLGGLKELIGKSLDTNDYEKDFHSTADFKEYIIINQNSFVSTDCAAEVKGKIVDTNGVPIKDILVCLTGVGRTDRTDANGDYGIRVYNDMHEIDSYDGQLIFAFSYFKGVYVSGDYSTTVYVSPLAGGMQYSKDFPFIVENIIFGVSRNSGNSFFKRGGLYGIGLVYFDDPLRCGSVDTLPELMVNIPFYTQDLNEVDPVRYPVPQTFNYGAGKIFWELFHNAPKDRRYYAIVRTQNLAYSSYLQWAVNEVKYVVSLDSNGNSVDTEFETNLANFIFLSVENFQNYRDENFQLAFETDKEIKVGYTYEKGDRMRFMRDYNGKYFETYIDLPIKEMHGLYIIIEALDSLQKLYAGTVIEIYNPGKKLSDNIYYEIGQFYEIDNAYTENASHSVVSGEITSGDTYIIPRRISTQDTSNSGRTVYSLSLESAWVSDFYESTASDIGRAHIIDKDAKRKEFTDGLRFSNKYISDTQVNGLCSFEAANNAFLTKEFGWINKLVRSNISNREVLLAIMDTETISLYIGEAQINDGAGQKLLAISNDVIGNASVLAGGYGTQHPESVVERDGRVFFYCISKAKAVRYSGDGLTAVSDYRFVSWMEQIKAEISSQDNVHVYGGFDPQREEYFLSFSFIRMEYVPVLNTYIPTPVYETVSYNEDFNRWTGWHSFGPEFMAKVETKLFSFVAGRLWEHDTNEIRNNYYGVQYKQRIKPVFNVSPQSIKIWKIFAHKSNIAWKCTKIFNTPTSYNINGQETELIAEDFSDFEGMFWAALLRDKNTPDITDPLIQGEEMRSEVLEAEYENSETKEVVLYQFYANAIPSNITL